MAEKIYLNLLLLCGVLSSGIIGNLADENIKGSSDILIRQKRVINRIPGEDQKVMIAEAPYIVHIKENLRISCVGSILSRHVVITIPECVFYETTKYHVFSGSSQSDSGAIHNVTGIRRRLGNHPRRPEDGVALLTVLQPFMFGRYTAFIELHSGPLLPGTLGTVYGWGFSFRSQDRGTEYTRNLRLIQVPILEHRECVNIYRPHNIEISDKDICTYHPQKHCGHTDGGAPLVVDGYLAGVHLWTGINRNQVDSTYPDVFAVLQDFVYSQWITSNIRNIESSFNNHK